MYTIIPEEQGTKIRKKKFLKVLRRAIVKLEDNVSLDKNGCYVKPKVTSKSKELKKLVKDMNHYARAEITYLFGEDQEVLDGEEISQWITVDDQQHVGVSGEQIADYVNRLADNWDTAGKTRKFKTSYGKKVEIDGGDYGWKIDRAKETEALTALIQEGKVVAREPEYEKTANNPGKKDYGDTYVEVNLTAQHLIYYKDGKMIVESDFVSGNEARGWSTPTGRVMPARYLFGCLSTAELDFMMQNGVEVLAEIIINGAVPMDVLTFPTVRQRRCTTILTAVVLF